MDAITNAPSTHAQCVMSSEFTACRTMKIDVDLSSVDTKRELVLTIGTFDGVHLGHRHLVRQVERRAQQLGCASVAITFHPHPRKVIAGYAPPCLSTLDERLALLRGLGLDVVMPLQFTPDLARLRALDFMSLLCESMRVRELWVGSDFALGYQREGTIARLAEIGRVLGYDVHGVPPLVLHGQIVSSTLIRELIGHGQVESVCQLLTRPYHVSGIAMPAEQRDRHPAFATATVVVPDGLSIPARGVYDACVRSSHRQWSTAACVETDLVGTVQRLELSASYLPEDVYGQLIQVDFIRRLQPGVTAQPARTPPEKTRAQRQVLSPA